MRPLALLALGLFGALAAGVQEGRIGNRLLADGDAPGAEEAYIAGLAQEYVPPEARLALWHNLGLARFEANRVAEADSAFADALPWAADPDARARVAYNLGTAALAGGDLTRAVAALRRALLLRPDDAAAQVNLEIALLRLRRGDDDTPEAPEPSEFAQRLKAQADSLVEIREYADALSLMNDGLARDSSVAAFGDFLGRLGEIVQIDTAPDATPAPDSTAARQPAAR